MAETATIDRPQLSLWLEKGIGLAFPFLVALLVASLVLLLIGENPIDVFSLMFAESFGTQRRIAATLSAATPLLFTGIATAICFRSGVFNVGVEGALVIGGLCAAFIGFTLPAAMSVTLIPLAFGFAAIVSAIWLYIPGVLLARYEVDEVVSTLMLNFVAFGITGYLVNGPLLSEISGNNVTPLVHEAAQLRRLLPPSTLHAGFLVGVALVVIYGIWTRRTPSGFESALVGQSKRFSSAVGISIPTTIVLVMVLSGVISGMGGASHALGQLHRFADGFSPGYGFTGMAVALLGRNNALGIFLGAVLFGALASAGTTVQLFSDIPLDIVNIIEGTVMIFAVVELGRITLLRRRSGG
ncbi:MAG: ABC transporter permease [Hyphomicrobiales bacterium]|nr:ABC transporter permease [Hyphomicrobiales bacterium]MCP4997611.1 ABC transporter permease [Hyphomicrobiales bacterium]